MSVQGRDSQVGLRNLQAGKQVGQSGVDKFQVVDKLRVVVARRSVVAAPGMGRLWMSQVVDGGCGW